MQIQKNDDIIAPRSSSLRKRLEVSGFVKCAIMCGKNAYEYMVNMLQMQQLARQSMSYSGCADPDHSEAFKLAYCRHLSDSAVHLKNRKNMGKPPNFRKEEYHEKTSCNSFGMRIYLFHVACNRVCCRLWFLHRCRRLRLRCERR